MERLYYVPKSTHWFLGSCEIIGTKWVTKNSGGGGIKILGYILFVRYETVFGAMQNYWFKKTIT